MNLWNRCAPLTASQGQQEEIWIYSPPGRSPQKFTLTVRTGKPLDVIALKDTSLTETRDYATMLSKTAIRLYGQPETLSPVSICRCCGADADGATTVIRIFGVPYRRCSACGHVFVGDQPDEATINAVFRESEDHSHVYVDPRSIETRMQQVVSPKSDWSLNVYREVVGGRPTSCIDVGAGGGHFVEGMRRLGIDAVGFELSQTSRTFAANAFGLNLLDQDFLESEAAPANLITMWGLLEYTPQPRKFLAQARRRLSPREGLLVVEVPRFDALGTVSQAENPSNVARHMDPTSHLNCFSDASLATALVEEGFHPVAAWYFGMDAYELLIQTALRMDDERVMARMVDMIPALQASCDSGRQCDDLIIAAVPA